MPVEHGGRHYNAHISFARYGKNQRPLARCILLTDVTDTVELLAETKRQSGTAAGGQCAIASQNDELRGEPPHRAGSRRAAGAGPAAAGYSTTRWAIPRQ